MRSTFVPACFVAGVLFSGCAAFESAGDVAQGRQALMKGNNQAALGYFQAAEKTDPHYIFGTELHEGVLSYVGRAQYLTGNYPQARRTLEQALFQNKDDDIARLYLGLTLVRQGETEPGLKQIDTGMEGIYDFINYITDTFRFSFGKDWDSGREIRSAIESDRAMIASGKIDWPTLIADGESLALKTEREPDLVRHERESHRPMFR